MAVVRSRIVSSCVCCFTSLLVLWRTDLDDIVRYCTDHHILLFARSLPTRRRPIDPWFNADCRAAKRLTQVLVRLVANHRSGRLSPHTVAAKSASYPQRRSYRQLCRRKCQEFWRCKVESGRSDPRRFWQSIDRLIGRSPPSPSKAVEVAKFSDFLIQNVTKISTAAAGTPLPEFTHSALGARFVEFHVVSVYDVIAVIGRLPEKLPAIDPMPTLMLKVMTDLMSPFVAELFCHSIAIGQIPSCFKHAYITPIVKKAGLDNTEPSSYRPISNLSVLSKTL
jgi:hypothetical protein